MSDDDAQGSWTVEGDHETDSVRIRFDEIGPDGVQTFQTGMPAVCAINFALDLIAHATCVLSKDH